MTSQSKALIDETSMGGKEKEDEKYGIKYYQTVAWNLEQIAKEEIYSKGDPCDSKGGLSDINRNLQKLFVFLRGVQKYGNFYINGAINKVQNLKNTISAITGAIAGVLKSLVQRLRNWVLNKLKSLILAALELIMTNFLRTIKESIVAAVVDQIFCSFEKIIAGLFGLVGDFLYSLIGQVIQTPFCAAEKFTNALINRLTNDIDRILGPIFDNINDILGGVGKIFGSVSSAIDFILGFQGFLCGGPECPEVKEFSLQGWGGPSKAEKDNFANFNFGISPNFPGEISAGADEWMDNFFGPEGNQAQSPGQCYTGNFECGIPQVVIFGGGGSGAVAQAVVNNVGQVIGTNLLNGGSGYKSPPFVQIVDPAGCGADASGFANMATDDDGYETGELSGITIANPGTGYESTYNGGAPSITSFYGAPNPLTVNNSVTLNWNVVNADEVSLQIEGYTTLPLVGSATLPVMEDDVTFAPNETQTTKTFTLKATKINQGSSPQVVEQTFILTVNQEGESSENVNTEAPVISSFTASNTNVVTGELVLLSWETQNAETVSLSGAETNDSLPLNGAITTVIPNNLNFPSDGSGVALTYTLTAENDNGIASQNNGSIIQTTTQSITLIATQGTPPDSIPGVNPPEEDDDDGTGGDGDGTGGDGDGGNTADDTTGGGGTSSGGGNVLDDGGTTTGSDTTTTSGGDGDGTGGTSGTGNNDAVATIDTVDIIDTGIGYTDGDTVTLDDGDGGSFQIGVNNLGQIVNFTVLETGYGYTKIPTASVSSAEGLGARFRVNLKFTPLNEFIKTGQVVDPNKLVQVIDCIGNTRPNIGYVNGAPYSGPFHIHTRADGTTVRMVGVNHTSEFHETIYDTLEESLGQVNQRIVQPQQSTTTTTTTTTTPTSTSSNTTTTTTTTTSPSTSSGSSSSGSSGSSGSGGSGSSGSGGSGSSGGGYGY